MLNFRFTEFSEVESAARSVSGNAPSLPSTPRPDLGSAPAGAPVCATSGSLGPRLKRRAAHHAARLERGGDSIPHRLPVAVEGHHDLLTYWIQRRVPQHVGQPRFLARKVGVDLR